jgi:hypothetical protein
MATPSDLPEGWVMLRCPPGAEGGAISHGETSYRAYRLHKASDTWLVEVPREAAFHLTRIGGFVPYGECDRA